MKIKFKRDTSFRKTLFTADHFAHPAKMDAQLLIWLTERYTKVGETILDPMAGSGTTMLACMIGRNVILVELEQKFVGMQEANWDKVKMMPQLGYQMGDCKILKGDARKLEGLVDGIITSPPYAEAQATTDDGYVSRHITGGKLPTHHVSAENIGNLPYGSIDSVITSNQGQGDDKLAIVYIALFEVDNPIVILVKAFIPSAVFHSLLGRTMPEIAINFDNSVGARDKEINEISTDLELSKKLNAMLFKVFGNLHFQTGEAGISITFNRAEDASITFKAIGLDIEGLPAKSTFAFNSEPARFVEALGRAESTEAPSLLRGLGINIPTTSGAGMNSPTSQSNPLASFRAILTTIAPQFACPSSEGSPTNLTDSSLPTLSRSTHLTPVSIIPQNTISSIITSPPYEEGLGHKDPRPTSQGMVRPHYTEDPNADNIGNLTADSYLSAMLQVYQQCYKVLKPQGLMILVTKNFIRNKEEVRLDEDTIKLCEQAGFQFVERHYRKLPAQSFWRVIYQQKYPDAPVLDKEDILIFKRELASMPLLGE